VRRVNAARDREIGAHAAVENCHPTQWQTQVIRITQDQPRCDFEVLQIKVGLVEAIEKDQTIRSVIG